MSERVNLADRNTGIFLKFVRSQQTQYRVAFVGENDITGRVQFNENMMGMFTLAKSQVNNTINAKLLNIF